MHTWVKWAMFAGRLPVVSHFPSILRVRSRLPAAHMLGLVQGESSSRTPACLIVVTKLYADKHRDSGCATECWAEHNNYSICGTGWEMGSLIQLSFRQYFFRFAFGVLLKHNLIGRDKLLCMLSKYTREAGTTNTTTKPPPHPPHHYHHHYYHHHHQYHYHHHHQHHHRHCHQHWCCCVATTTREHLALS